MIRRFFIGIFLLVVQLPLLAQHAELIWKHEFNVKRGNIFTSAFALDEYGNAYYDVIFQGDTLHYLGKQYTDKFRNGYVLFKADSTGKVVWSKQAEDAGDSIGSSFASSWFIRAIEKELLITLQFRDTITWDSDTLRANHTFASTIEKIDQFGKVLFRHQLDGFVNLYAVDVTSNGEIIIEGAFSDSLLAFGQMFRTNKPSHKLDHILICLHPDGKKKWMKVITNGGSLYYPQLAIDRDDNVYLGGKYVGELEFEKTSITNPNGLDDHLVLAKFDPNGNEQWVRSFGGEKDNIFEHLSIGSGEDIRIAAVNRGAPYRMDGVVIPTGHFLTRFSPLGRCLSLENTFYNLRSIAFNQYGEYFTGEVHHPNDFDEMLTKYSNSNQKQFVLRSDALHNSVTNTIRINNLNQVLCRGKFHGELILNGDTLNKGGVFGGNSFIAMYRDLTATSVRDELSELAYDFDVFPNPSQNQLNVTFNMEQAIQVSFSLHDIRGVVHWTTSETLGEGGVKYVLDVSHLPRGVYFLKVHSTLFQLHQQVLIN